MEIFLCITCFRNNYLQNVYHAFDVILSFHPLSRASPPLAATTKAGAVHVTRFFYRVHVTVSPVHLLEKFSGERRRTFRMRGCPGDRNDLVNGCSITNSGTSYIYISSIQGEEAEELILHAGKTAIFPDENTRT